MRCYFNGFSALMIEKLANLSVDKYRHFLTPSPPHLVHVVIEQPLVHYHCVQEKSVNYFISFSTKSRFRCTVLQEKTKDDTSSSKVTFHQMFGKKNFWFVVVPNYVAKTLMKSHFNFKLFKFQVNKTNFRLNVKKACEIVKV